MRTLLYILLFIPLVGAGQIKGSWKLNGNSTDYSTYGNNGLDYNVSYLSAGAAYFDGTSGTGIVIPLTNPLPIGANPRTINILFYGLIQTVNNPPIFVYGSSSTAGKRFNINIDTVNSRINIGYKTAQQYSASFTYKYRWNMITVVVPSGADSTNDVLIYINGDVSTSTYSGTSKLQTTQDISYPCIGNATSTNTPITTPFKGYIREVYVDNTAWSAAKVKTIYAYQTGKL